MQEAADGLAASGATIAILVAVFAGMVLLVLGVLVPWFVWRTSVYTRDIRAVGRRMANDLETVRKEVRAIANVTTGTKPPLYSEEEA